MIKRILILSVVALCLFVGISLTVLYIGYHQVREKQDQIIQDVTRQQWLETVSEVAFFASEKNYHIAKGIDAQGIEKWIWYNEEEMYEIPTNGLISSENAVEKARQLYPRTRLIRITPGLFKQRPVWVVFLKEKELSQGYVYLYMQMTDGRVIRELRLR